jgi:electron transfer flavoprotein alpha subunit
MSQNVLVVAEAAEGSFRKVTFEAVSTGRLLADQLGGQLTVVALGASVAAKASELSAYGADQILVTDDEQFDAYLYDTYTAAIGTAIGEAMPQLILLGATMLGKDLAARLAARLNAPLAVDCIQVSADGDGVKVTRPVYGGKLLAEVSLTGQPVVVAIRPNTFAVNEQSGAGEVQNLDVEIGERDLTLLAQNLETGKLELTEAEVIVSGGRGMGGSDYSLLEKLADLLGGAVGASRSAVDEGWRPHSDQVGQTGKVVSPTLYIACGISGAIQHLAGMSSSKIVVAINKDADAPIFSKADYGVVGDLFELLPLLTDAIAKIKA